MPHAHTANEFRVVLSSEEDQCDYICASVLDVSTHTHTHTHHTPGYGGITDRKTVGVLLPGFYNTNTQMTLHLALFLIRRFELYSWIVLSSS